MDNSIIDQAKLKLLDDQGKIVAQLEEMTQKKSFDKDKVQAKWQEVGDKDEDSAVEVADFQDKISLERNLETSLEKIEKALDKISKGLYGKCDQCGQEIETNRLLAYPEAGRCLKCHHK
ncbi:TraR/DksA C4-type zinc finger protein [Patescibacteria group bacterium]|nr:TraR/DksA C4-type zinc finger protein [Patescibacteria group bacterium]